MLDINKFRGFGAFPARGAGSMRPYAVHNNPLRVIARGNTCKAMPAITLHSGRTDCNFGHNVFAPFEIEVFSPARNLSGQSVRGTERYHYHHGIGPHQHPNGVCPYAQTVTKVTIIKPAKEEKFLIGQSLIVRASALNAARVQLLINNQLWDENANLIPNQVILFKPYELMGKGLGSMDITAVAYASKDEITESSVATVVVSVGVEGVYAKPCTIGKEYSYDLPQSQKEANAVYIYNYLTQRGWTMEAIAGLMGNIQQESQFNPGVWQFYNNVEGGYGLVQWTMTKYEDGTLTYKFFDWAEGIKQEDGQGHANTAARANDIAENDAKRLMDLQLEYLNMTMQPGHGEWLIKGSSDFLDKFPLQHGTSPTMSYEEYISSTADAGDLALIFHSHYERSLDGSDVLEDRYEYAREWFEFLSNLY